MTADEITSAIALNERALKLCRERRIKAFRDRDVRMEIIWDRREIQLGHAADALGALLRTCLEENPTQP